MLDRFNTLQAREQKILGFGALLLLILLLYEAVWTPLNERVELMHNQVSAQQQRISSLQQIVTEYQALQPVETSRPRVRQSLLSLLDRTSKQHQIKENIRSLTPDGNQKVRMRIVDAEFDRLAAWLANLSKLGLKVQQIDINREDAEGLVSAGILVAGG
ncbi:MAG: type II secretion system protein GspM [Chromatiales bacterium]|jgi:type II secretory pathway component PulM